MVFAGAAAGWTLFQTAGWLQRRVGGGRAPGLTKAALIEEGRRAFIKFESARVLATLRIALDPAGPDIDVHGTSLTCREPSDMLKLHPRRSVCLAFKWSFQVPG